MDLRASGFALYPQLLSVAACMQIQEIVKLRFGEAVYKVRDVLDKCPAIREYVQTGACGTMLKGHAIIRSVLFQKPQSTN